MPSVLERDFEYFVRHHSEFVQKYVGRFLLIRDESVIGDYGSEMEAIRAGAERFPLGMFLVQKCEPGSESYTQTFHSRVSFPS